MDLLRAQTKNLPAIVKDPLVEVLGPKCFKTLVDELDVSDVGCLKFAVSKALSLGMVAGGGILKIPQIVTIVQAKSARGLSLSSYLLDTASLVFFNTYNLRLGFPLVSYGENLAILGQNIVIVSLILALGTTSARTSGLPLLQILAFAAITLGGFYALYAVVPLSTLTTAFTLSIPLSLISKLPQIYANAKQGSTGQLSSFVVLASFMGTVARLYTTSQETGDVLLLGNYALASALNGILAMQVLSSASNRAALKARENTMELHSVTQDTMADASRPAAVAPKVSGIQMAPAATMRSPTPSARSNRTPSRQWVRKAD